VWRLGVGLVLAVAVSVAGAEHAVPARAAAPPRPPIVMIVFDEFPADSLLGPDGGIDAARFPNFARLAREATWFPNATTVADWTWLALPAILTGRMPGRGRTHPYRDPQTLFRLLAERGYGFRSTEEITTLCRYRGCRNLGSRGFVRKIGADRMARLDATIASIRRSRRPTFTFHHTLLPHAPWIHLPSGRRYQAGNGDFRRGLAGPPGFHDPWLTLHNEQRYLLQLGAVDLAVGRLLTRLRDTGLYDRALVVLTADHGLAFQLNVADRRKTTAGNIDQIASVPLFIKAPRQRTGAVSRAYARSVDLVPTIAEHLRLRLPWRVDGRPVGSAAVAGRRRVVMLRRTLRGVVTIGARELERRRRANLRARLARLGFGPWASSVFAVGPHRDLLGRATARVRAPRRYPVKAVLRAGRGVGTVDRRSGYVPTLVAGRIEGGRPGAARDLAVAVNSRVWALGRSFHLRKKKAEFFSMVLPEEALRQGRNTLTVLEVRGRELIPIAQVR
jgi:Sulfatase